MSENRIAIEADDHWPGDTDDDEGVVVDWFVRERAAVDEGDTLCEIQVEKASADVLAPVQGILDEIVVEEDGEFTRDDTLAWIQRDR
jgi:pyruvate/2-oxoglutarate dehydrogenase complex dihydrolipoamide acyltransferase (E2) component